MMRGPFRDYVVWSVKKCPVFKEPENSQPYWP